MELSPIGGLSIYVYDPALCSAHGCHGVPWARVSIYQDGPLPFKAKDAVPLVSTKSLSDGHAYFRALWPGTFRWRAELKGRTTEEGRIEFVDRAGSGCATVYTTGSRTYIDCPTDKATREGAVFSVYLGKPVTVVPVFDGSAAAVTAFSAGDLNRLPWR